MTLPCIHVKPRAAAQRPHRHTIFNSVASAPGGCFGQHIGRFKTITQYDGMLTVPVVGKRGVLDPQQ